MLTFLGEKKIQAIPIWEMNSVNLSHKVKNRSRLQDNSLSHCFSMVNGYNSLLMFKNGLSHKKCGFVIFW